MWAFLRYDLRLTEREAQALRPVQLLALADRWGQQRAWWADKIAAVVQYAGNWAKEPPRRDEIFPECKDR